LLIAANVHPKAVQARLGHASIKVTMDTYGHLMSSGFTGVGAKLDALLASAQAQKTEVNA
jgi:integrase